MFGKILVAIDGSEGAKKALKVASDLAKHYESELHSISVEELPHYAATKAEWLEGKQEAADYFRSVVIEAAMAAAAAGAQLTTHVVSGHEVETIVAFAEKHAFDLLVIGFMGHSKIFGRNWGSTSHNLAQLAPCSVLVVK